MRVIQLVNDTSSDVRQLADTVSSDQALTARILRVVNSSYYGLPSRISSVPQAVLVLGYQTLKSLALGVSLHGFFLGRTEQWDPLQLWRHSCAAAVAGRLIAKAALLPNCEEAYVAGLLHDAGKTVFMREFPSILQEACIYSDSKEVSLEEAQRAICGVDDAEIGAFLAKRWNLAPTLQDALAYRNFPEQAPEEHQKLAAVVSLGDHLANVAGFRSGLPGDSLAANTEAVAILNFGQEILEELPEAFNGLLKSVEELTAIWEEGGSDSVQAA